MRKLKNTLKQSEFHVLFFGLAFFLFFFPILRGDNENRQDLMYIYFFMVWALFIVVLFIISRALKKRPKDQ